MHITLEEAYSRLGKLAKLGGAQPSLASFETIEVKRKPFSSKIAESFDIPEDQEEEYCKKMVETLGQRSRNSSTSSGTSNPEEELIRQKIRPKTSKSRMLS